MIISVPKKVLTPGQKTQLVKKGYVVIECDEPEKIRVLNPETNIDTNDYLMAALYALKESCPVYKQQYFVNELFKRLKEKEETVSIETTNPE